MERAAAAGRGGCRGRCAGRSTLPGCARRVRAFGGALGPGGRRHPACRDADSQGRAAGDDGPAARVPEHAGRCARRVAGRGDRAREADCQGVLGLVNTELGDPRQAVALIEQALALRRSVAPLPAAEAALLNYLAVALGNLGDLSAAVDCYSKALALARGDGDPNEVALLLKNRAMDQEQLGESRRALADLGEARDTFQSLGNAGGEGNAEYALGIALEHLGRTGESWRAFERALPLLERAGDARFVAFALNHLGLLRLETGRPDQARELFQQSLQRLEATGDRRSAITVRVDIARTLTAGGRAAEAIAPLTARRGELHAIGDRVHEAICLTELARAEMATGRLLEARRHVLEALELTEELRGSITGPSARAAYAAVVHGRYELLAGALMALHAREPRARLGRCGARGQRERPGARAPRGAHRSTGRHPARRGSRAPRRGEGPRGANRARAAVAGPGAGWSAPPRGGRRRRAGAGVAARRAREARGEDARQQPPLRRAGPGTSPVGRADPDRAARRFHGPGRVPGGRSPELRLGRLEIRAALGGAPGAAHHRAGGHRASPSLERCRTQSTTERTPPGHCPGWCSDRWPTRSALARWWSWPTAAFKKFPSPPCQRPAGQSR